MHLSDMHLSDNTHFREVLPRTFLVNTFVVNAPASTCDTDWNKHMTRSKLKLPVGVHWSNNTHLREVELFSSQLLQHTWELVTTDWNKRATVKGQITKDRGARAQMLFRSPSFHISERRSRCFLPFGR